MAPPPKNMRVRRPREVEEEVSPLEVMSASHVCVSTSVHQSCYEEEPDSTLQMLDQIITPLPLDAQFGCSSLLSVPLIC